MARRPGSTWGRAAVHAAPILPVVLSLFYYWFAVADRYSIFLYGHLGATPFDAVTSSRYWMAGLVAAGIVMLLYTAWHWLAGRLAAWRGARSEPPPAWQVWSLCALPLAVGIPAITLAVNQPTLPWSLALACVLAAWVGLGLALMPGAWAAQRPGALVWLVLDGAALMPVLLLLRALELPARGLISPQIAALAAGGSLVASVLGLGALTLLRRWRRQPSPGAAAILAAGLAESYVLMPLVHYLFMTPAEYRYITTASNFFAWRVELQLVAFLIAGLLAVGAAGIRRRLR